MYASCSSKSTHFSDLIQEVYEGSDLWGKRKDKALDAELKERDSDL